MLKTGLLITGDASTAQKAVEDLKRSVDQLGAAGKSSAAGLGVADAAQQAAATSAKAMAQAQADAAAAIKDVAGAAGAAGAAIGAVGVGAGGAAGAVDNATEKIRKHTQAANDNEAAAKRSAFGMRNLGQQAGDMAVMIQGGIDPMRAFATQAGQMGYALSEMGGKAGAVGAFLTGPWGIALTIAVTSLAPFISKLWETEQAAKAAEVATSHLGDAQNAVADLFGKASSKIAEQNELLKLNARIKAGDLRTQAAIDARESSKVFSQAGAPGIVGGGLRALNTIFGTGEGRGLDMLGIGTGSKDAFALAARARNANKIKDSGARTQAFDDIIQDSFKANFQGSGIDGTKFREAVSKAAGAKLDVRLAELIDKSLDAGAVDPLLKKAEREKKAKKPKSTEARDEFGRDAAMRIEAIKERFDDTPPMVRQVAQARRELADMMEDLARRQPKGFEKLIASAKEAGSVIEAGINRPFNDFLDAQQQQLDQGALILQGRQIEAEAMRTIVAIERQRGPLSAEQRAEIVASVAALREQERQLERIHAVQEINLNALEDMRQIVTQTIYEGPQSLVQLPQRVFDSFKRFSAEKIGEEWFGEMFRDARDQITGANKVDQASNVIVGAFDRVAASADALAGRMAGGESGTAGAVTSRLSDGDLGKAIAASAAGAMSGVIRNMGGASFGNAGVAEEGKEVVVRGRRQAEVYADTMAGVLKKVGIGDKTATDIGKGAGKALAGAFEGQAAAGVAGMLGIKTSGTGGAIGGAIGSFLPIPGGSIIGGLAGGIIGGLFGQKKDSGTSVITSQGDVSATGTNRNTKTAASGLAGSVQDGLASIAERLGGQIGSYLVSIGTYDGDYRVSTSGQSGELSFGKKNKNKATLVDFGSDQAAAIAFAIGDAVKDGAITGLSGAVTKALQSSTDVNKAMAEAIKVQDVETSLKGLSGTFQKAFVDLEAQAKDRVRIATQYGFDVVAIEKKNAEDRTALAEQLVQAQAGSLQSLVKELTSGSLFEGTAMERIDALNKDIAAAKLDLDAGKDGAADTLANLYAQRLAASETAYGKTGAYAADRNATIAEAQAAIARVNQQVTAAQSKSDPALATTNQALDENNDQNAQLISAVQENTALLRQLMAAGGTRSTFDLDALARV